MLARLGLGILIGGIGGSIFAYFHVPLAWMLGSMTAYTVAAMCGAPIAVPSWLRSPLAVVIGIMLGSSFTPTIFDDVGLWTATLLGLVIFLLVGGMLCVVYLRFAAGHDMTTAFFSGMPGGLNDMVLLGDRHKADIRLVALTRSARILLVVSSLPALLTAVGHVSIKSGGGLAQISWSTQGFVWASLSGLIGVGLGRILRLPASVMLGPMIVSGFVHVAGWSAFAPPIPLMNAVQVGMSVIVGCRFVRTYPAMVLPVFMHSAVISVVLLGIAALCGMTVQMISGHNLIQLMLAYSPGGMTEMSMIALALNLEVAFVTAHHIVRIFLVILAAQTMASTLFRNSGKSDSP